MFTSAIAVIITFGLVIFIHELGHFLVCKAVKIRVEEFAFGFGKTLWSRKRGDTVYALRAIPLGGFVKPAGDSLEEAKGASDEYFSKPWYQRLLVALAGPMMNYLLAFVLFTSVLYAMGEPFPSDKPVIGEMVMGHPAQAAGLRPGDRILALDGKESPTWTALAEYIHGRPGKEIKVSYQRGEEKAEVAVTASTDPSGKYGMIGIAPQAEYKPIPLLTAVGNGAYQCYHWTKFTLVTLGSKIYHRQDPDLAGPVGIVQMVGQAAHTGMENLVYLVALISVAIAIFNLFPIPILDGGHIMLYLWEGVSRRKLTEKLLLGANNVGFALLISIFLFATYSDISRIYKSRRAASERKKAAAASVAVSSGTAAELPAGQ
ncbi:MAG: site-2 protease family protein [Elusimicrobia bacterium]|nr:site-2 protease family protein [Elusimicrobiota bacterium]